MKLLRITQSVPKLFSLGLILLLSQSTYSQQFEKAMGVQKDFYAQVKTEQLTKYLVENAEAINQENSINSKFMVKQAFSLIGFGLERVLRYSFENLSLVDSVVIQQLMQTGFFEYVERVPVYETSFVPNDYQSQQWHLKKINAFGAFDRIGNTSNMVIAIVDDGLDTAHPDIHPNLWHNLKEIPGNGIDDDFNGFIDDYVGWNVYNNTNNPNADATFQKHGTHCAGIASAATDNGLGIASMGYGAKIMIVKCGDTTYNPLPRLNNRGKVFNSDNGVEYAIKNKADIISMSFGIVGYYSITSQKIFDLADSKGIICVAAAGNDTSNSISYPAGYNHVISVASTDSNDRKSSFSSYNSTVDISAPGRDIYSTVPYNSYAYLSGTSMACPMVSGLIASIKSRRPAAAKQEIEHCLLSTAKNIDGINPYHAGKLGSGRIDADAALKCMKKVNADFTSNFNKVCPGTAVQFSEKCIGNPYLFSWKFTLGSPANSFAKTPTVIYNTAGGFEVQLIACDSFECDTIIKNPFIKVGTPTAKIFANKNVYKGDLSYFSVDFTGTPPFQFTYTDGTNIVTRKNIWTSPYQESFMPDSTKKTVKIWLTSMKDSLCTGVVSDTGRYTIIPYRTCTFSVKSHHKIASNTTGFTSVLTNTSAFGFQTASVGDLDKNGFEDFVISAPYKTIGSYSYGGSLYTIFMDSNGKVKNYKQITQSIGGYSGTMKSSFFMGAGLSTIGDFDKDGIRDIAFWGLGSDGGTDKGEIYLGMMKSDGTLKSHHKISLTSGNFSGPLVGTSNFGNEIDTLGDIDGNGSMDIVVAAYQDGANGYQKGATFILLLDSNKKVVSSNKISDLTTGLTGALDNTDQFGNATSLGDLDKDSVIDIAVSSYWDDDAGTDVGAVYVLFMKKDGTVKKYSKITKNVNGGPSDLNAGDALGYEVKNIGDWDGDGITDLAISALLKDDGGADKGAVYLCFMNPDGSIREYQKISSTSGNFTATLNASNQFGSSILSIDDYDKNGHRDLLIGSRFDDEGGSQRGAAWILNMQKICATDSLINQCRLAANFNINPLCYTDNQNFNSISIDSNAQTIGFYKWYLGNGDSVLAKNNFSYKYKNAGMYQVTLIAGSDGRRTCFDTFTKTVVIPDSFQIRLSPPQKICYGDSFEINIADVICEKDNILVDWYPSQYFKGPYLFHNPKIGVLKTEKIWAVARNKSGKVTSDTILITVDSNCCKTHPIAETNQQVYCLNDTLFIANKTKTTGPATFEWTFSSELNLSTYTGLTPPPITFNKAGSANFQLKVTDFCGVNAETFYIGIGNAPYGAIEKDTFMGCVGNTILAGETLIGYNGYTWYPMNEIIEEEDGFVRVKVKYVPYAMYRITTDPQTGCTSSDSILIAPFSSQPKIFSFKDTTLCSTDSLLVVPNVSVNSYLWSNGATSKDITVKQPGIYWLEATSLCTLRDSFVLRMDTLNPISIFGDTVLCNSQSSWLKALPKQTNAQYLWNNTVLGDSFKVLNSGLVVLTASKGKCMQTIQRNVETYLPANSLRISGDSFSCYDSVALQSNLSGNLLWSNGATNGTVSVKNTGSYWLKIKENICEQYDTMEVEFVRLPKFTLGNDTMLCDSSNILLSPKGIADTTLYSASWNDGLSQFARNSNQTGVFILTIQEKTCQKSDTIEITLSKRPKVLLIEDTLICSNDSIELKNLYPNFNSNILWSTGNGNAQIMVHEENTYWLQLSNVCGKSADTFALKKKNCLCKIHVPNAFTPNNDGLNDGFKPQFDGCNLTDYQFNVYNRWGEKLFESKDENEFWDGKRAQKGSYYWVLKLASPYIDGGKVIYMQGLVIIN